MKNAIDQGRNGEFLPERIEILKIIHEFIEEKLAGGGSSATAKNQYYRVVNFFDWATEAGLPMTVASISESYLQWAEHLYQRWKVNKDISQTGAYANISIVGSILDSALGRNRPISSVTRLKKPRCFKTPQGRQAEKQSLSDTFSFGYFLHDICDGLSLEAISKPRIQIFLRNGKIFEPWTGESYRREKHASPDSNKLPSDIAHHDSDKSFKRRHRGYNSIINIRIMAELLIFIAQTGMNLAQASNLDLHHYSYESSIDGYKVRIYKARRQGEVQFEIFSDYRAHLERYLQWRRVLFPNSEKLFPLIKYGAPDTKPPTFDLIRRGCEEADIPWIPPSTLRATRVNWLLRRSGDPDMTAEVAQHSKQTLLKSYERPSQHRAENEVTRFWLIRDPTLSPVEAALSVAPGECDGIPVESPSKPTFAPSPDCLRPSGCLWCEHHRDIDTQDYVWAIASFRYLKILEVSKHIVTTKDQELAVPAQYVVNMLSQKLKWFRDSNSRRNKFVEEALSRIEMGQYHPEWGYLIIPAGGPKDDCQPA